MCTSRRPLITSVTVAKIKYPGYSHKSGETHFITASFAGLPGRGGGEDKWSEHDDCVHVF